MTMLIQGDAIDTLKLLPSESVDTIVTSPPYYLQRDYEVAGQIGREQTVRAYLERLWAVFDEAKRVLKSGGTCFVNLGDKYLDGCLQLVPEQFATGMMELGWIAQNSITWHKTNCMPHSVKTRFPSNSEAVYFFSKNRSHYFAPQFEPFAPATLKRFEQVNRNGEEFDPAPHKHGNNGSQSPMELVVRMAKKHKNLAVPGQKPHGMHIARAGGNGQDVFDLRGRRMKTVWSLPVARFAGLHFATWPHELARRIILAGCPPGGVVLDTFVGSGTTLIVAEELGCAGIGIDISEKYFAIARQEILSAREMRSEQGTIVRSRSRRSRGGNKRNNDVNRCLPADEAAEAIVDKTLPGIFEDI